MNLNLKNPLVFFDLETTGTNITTDRIIELAYVKVFPNGKTEEKDIYINPGMPIPPASTAVHHITDEMVADKPLFKDVARNIAKVFEGADIAGFNSNRFDVPLLIEELLRAGVNLDYIEKEVCRCTNYLSYHGASHVKSRLQILLWSAVGRCPFGFGRYAGDL